MDSKELYRSLFENIHDGILLTDANGNVYAANPAACRMLGRTEEEMRAVGMKGVVDSADPRSLTAIEEGARTDRFNMELTLNRKDGTRFAAEVTSNIFKDKNDCERISMILRDITERKDAEADRAKFENRMHTLHKLALELSLAKDIDNVGNYTLAALRHTLGFSLAYFLLTENYSLIIKRNKGESATFSALPLDGRGLTVRAANTKTTLRIPDTRKEPAYVDDKGHDWTGIPSVLSELIVPVLVGGEVVAVLTVDSKLLDAFTEDDQRLVETLAIHVSSAISRLRDEEKLKRYSESLEQLVSERTKKLTESEGTYRSLFESSPIPLWEEDFSNVKKYLDELRGDGAKDFRTHFQEHPEDVVRCLSLVKVLNVNQATLTLYRAKSLEDLTGGLSGVLNEESLSAFREEVLALAEGKTRFESDFVNQTLGGEVKYVRLILSIAPGYEGTLGKILVSMVDLTEYRRLERLRDELVAEVTDELMTPLVSMKGYVELMLSEPASMPEDLHRNLLIVKRNTDRLTNLTNQLVDLRKLGAGRYPLDLKPVNLQETLTESVKEIQPLIKEKKLNLHVDVGERPLMVKGDRVKLSRILMVLLDNAVKFTPERGTITLHAREIETAVQIQVSDTGVGLREEDLPRVFQPFAAIQRTEYVKGTGLGLSLAKALVETHGGKIWAESKGEMKGTTFTFTIPKQVEVASVA